MPVRSRLDVIVRERLDSQLRAERVAGAVLREMQKGAFKVERDAKRGAPAVFGFLRTSIHTVGPIFQKGRGAVSFLVRVGVKYGKFIEFGTGPAGVATYRKSPDTLEAMAKIGYAHGPGNAKFPPLDAIHAWAKKKGIPADRVWSIARAIARHGIKAHPFLIPAFEKNKEKIAADVIRAGERALAQKVGRG